MRKLFLGLVLSVLVILPAHFGYADVDESLVLYLPFDEGDGEVAEDQSQYGNDAEIISNTEWVKGKYGNAVEIIGANVDCVVVPNSDSLMIEGEISMMAWINNYGKPNEYTWIDKNCHNGQSQNSYGMGVWGTNIYLMLGSGGGRQDLLANPVPEAEEWGHVAGTYDGDTMKVYVNGELIGEQGQGFDLQGTNDSDVRIGCAKDRANFTFDGAIDEVVIFNRALSEAEIEQVMENSFLAVSSKGKLATTWASIKH